MQYFPEPESEDTRSYKKDDREGVCNALDQGWLSCRCVDDIPGVLDEDFLITTKSVRPVLDS